MKETIFLSVIIPIYNAERYLPQCIDNLLATGLEDMEIILVNDGSTDNSVSIIESYCCKYKNIRRIDQQNSGPSAARNNGLQSAKGHYIAFADADDYVEPNTFAKHISLLRENSVDIWASDFMRVADNGCVLDKVYQIKESSEPIIDNAYLPEFLAAKDCVWNVWRYIFFREFLEQNSLTFAEDYSIAEDLELVVRALSLGPKLAFYHEPYYSYRVNYGSSLTRVFSAEKIRQLMVMLKRAMGYLDAGEMDALIKAKLAREYILNLSALYEVKKAERVAVFEELRNSLELAESAAGAYKYAAKAVKLLQIPTAAWLLYMMKRMKRLVRRLKTNLFRRGQ